MDGILITHEHSDHIKGLGVISRKYGIPIYTTGGTADAMLRMKSLGKMPEGLIHEIREDEPFEIKDLTVNPFTIPHDAAQPVGYRLECGEHSVGIATDLGKYNDYIVKIWRIWMRCFWKQIMTSACFRLENTLIISNRGFWETVGISPMRMQDVCSVGSSMII